MEQKFVVTDEHGLHARPASAVVKVATPFTADLKLVSVGKAVNLKSLMSVLSMGLTKGSEFTLTAEGEDAQQALDTVGQALVEQGLAQRA
ncbi:HPr family phosphocarrier protein [Deinococcus radiophilus]|uniref:HPr family phosphocarrier protein n=1 Tax=Deinococcus radiophilus TaxID=32062 RepID=A0A431VSD7_9DEIO|nr:HPr family phosphocarrier protein [Deinococcus radiophilus]RTR26130.1 HPr family phosphocarrier protein [Deinococcus radiophilus]UFA51611.1 HPr family phosphocarrier protein [Deinococcus radiophilus]